MIRFFLSLLVLSFTLAPAFAQDGILEKLRQIESNNAVLSAKMVSIETKLDALAAKVDKLVTQPAVSQPAAVCANGVCQVPGDCGQAGCNIATSCASGACGQSSGQSSGGGCGSGSGLLGRFQARRAARRGY